MYPELQYFIILWCFAAMCWSLHLKGSGSSVDTIGPTYMWWLWPCRPRRLRHDMTWGNGAITVIIDWGSNYHHSDGPDPDKQNLWFDGSYTRMLHANVHSAESRVIGSEMCVVLNERLSSGERTALSSQIHHPLFSLLPPPHPCGITSTRVWKYPRHIIKASPNYSLFHFFSVFLWLWQMRLGHEMELLELSMQDSKAGTNKSHLSLFTREVWEQPHYTVARINLGPLSLPFTLGAWYNVLQGS